MSNTRPHLIFVITDQQRYDTIAALGFDHVQTPHLDRLVREGVSFSNCHITATSSAPARASSGVIGAFLRSTAPDFVPLLRSGRR